MSKIQDSAVIYFKEVDILKEETLIISNLNLEVSKGEFLFLTGKVGSGKSSIVRAIIGDVSVSGEEAYVAGMNLRELKDNRVHKLRRKLGVVFQDFKLLPDRTIAENLNFVLNSTGAEDKFKNNTKIDEVLESVGLKDKAHKFPYQLSGGEKQKAAIARALVNDPLLIVADEPTSNLDTDSAFEIIELLRNINTQKGVAVFIVTHNKSVLKRFPARTFICENMQCRPLINSKEIDNLDLKSAEESAFELDY